MSGLYGYGNTVTTSGSYTIFPVGWVLGLASLGGAGVTFKGDITDSLSFAPTLIGAINPYTVTSEDGANVTVDVGSTVLGLLTGSNFTADGGTINIAGDNIITALSGTNYTIENGGTINLGTLSTAEISALSGTGITFGTGGGTLVVTPASGVDVLTFNNISGFGNTGATIEIPGASYVTNATYDGTNTSITTNTGITISVNGDYTTSQNTLYQQDSDGNLYISASSANSSGSTGVLVCFLPGSMVRTPTGDVAVEDIRIGDTVLALDCGNNAQTVREVVWTGSQSVRVRSHLPDDEAGYPVRILKDAISDGVPYKDMLITAEHCLFLDGKFIPVRMLVNGRSIFYDRSITSYDYHHIETTEHSIITVDGMLTESYLDTGNRRGFRQTDNIVRIGRPTRNWTEDAAAPLGVSRAFVEPLFHQIVARAQAAGTARKESAAELTHDASLHLITDTGAVIRQAREHEGQVMFMIPTGVQSVRIVSRTSRPSDVIGPFVDDRRQLGLAIGTVTMFEAAHCHALTPHLCEQALDGWHALEREDMRWTSGNALLPLGPRHPNSAALLAIQIREKGPYLVAEPEGMQVAKRA
ncbi:hypothetical protein CFR73_11090 [Novacetimonas maltaceti]|uniref:Hedgehog/Intein (Hint) domain-containing protein n=1 Tax=Novacetimonas maltaceti TaxID=1203393 RepID=A0A2S3W1V7_9PROT|nr:Hint domain-containing protein [Novacetimonas maltaceti]POF62826.1 hypothetical protein KMAL_15490 [Novacetimonas maltaceti]PYD59584.1 hypothetical protein CFR73_11090 [Novacetimonas maltaceti]